MDVLYIIFNYLIRRFAIYHLFGEILEGTTIYSNAGNFRNFLRKIYTLTIEYAIKNSPKQIHLNEKGNPGVTSTLFVRGCAAALLEK